MKEEEEEEVEGRRTGASPVPSTVLGLRQTNLGTLWSRNFWRGQTQLFALLARVTPSRAGCRGGKSL